MASNRANVNDLVSDEPLDLSMKNNRLEKENFVRGPLVIQPNTMQQNVVVSRTWQTNVVVRSQESAQQVQQLEKVNVQPTPKASILPSLPPRTKRLRFNRFQINFMEQIFEIKKLLTAAEISETARLLNVKDFQVSGWIHSLKT
jgi:hypothetical protein